MTASDIEDQARRYVGVGRFPGDAINAYFNVAMNLGDEAGNHLIKPARLYENYLREVKCKGNPELVDAILRATDQGKVAQFDDCILRINMALEMFSSAQRRELAIKPILRVLETLI